MNEGPDMHQIETVEAQLNARKVKRRDLGKQFLIAMVACWWPGLLMALMFAGFRHVWNDKAFDLNFTIHVVSSALFAFFALGVQIVRLVINVIMGVMD